MTRRFLQLFTAVFFLTLLFLAARPHTVAADPAPAFWDAGDKINVWMDKVVDVRDMTGAVSVRCGDAAYPVARVEALETLPDPDKVVLAGTIQAALGGTAWQPDDDRTRMQAVGGERFAFVARLPQGRYEYKVARGGDWSDNYGQGFEKGGGNLAITVPPGGALVRFEADFAKRTILNSLDNPDKVPPPTAALAVMPYVQARSRYLCLHLARPLPPEAVSQPISVRFADGTVRPVIARDVLDEPAFFYAKDDLGAVYAKAQTTFKVWSPPTASAEVLLFRAASGDSYKAVPMQRGNSGVWVATVGGDLDGVYYQYRLTAYGATRTTADPYCRAASPDQRRSMVVDPARTNPPPLPVRSQRLMGPHPANATDAVVYELHLRDFTGDASSGVSPALRGTYLGLVAPGTRLAGTDSPTGLDYLRSLGVTHVQVMPFQEFSPGDQHNYDWGYASTLYDVPESQYGSHPDDPAQTIRDAKAMVAGLHDAGLGIVMDVVYNHTASAGDEEPLWATVPYFYYRIGPDGGRVNDTGVGNTFDDDHPMARRYVRDSLLYWLREYHVDGFRFDLLGVFSPETVRDIATALRAVRPDVLIYGEPWTGGGPTRFGKGAQRGLGVGVFNDHFRTVVRGETDGPAPGFALGGAQSPDDLRTVLSGSPDFAAAPGESVNYVSAHDNLTLWDKIQKSLPSADASLQRSALKLAGAMTLLSEGMPFLEGGAEMGRTKGGNGNSYNGGDAVNRFDWARGRDFAGVSDYYRGLIALRRAHPAFRLPTASAIGSAQTFLPAASLPPQTVAFTLDGTRAGDSWHQTLVVFHGGLDSFPLTLPNGPWRIAATGDRAGGLGDAPIGATLSLQPLSAYVLYR